MIPTREQPALQSPARRRGQASSHQPVGGTNPRANGHHPYPTPVAIGQHAPIPASGPERSAHFGSPRGPENHLSKMRWKMPMPTTTMSTFAIGRRFMPEAEGRPVSPDCRPTLRAAVPPLLASTLGVVAKTAAQPRMNPPRQRSTLFCQHGSGAPACHL